MRHIECMSLKTLSEVARRNKRNKTEQESVCPYCGGSLKRGRALCTICANEAFKEFWALLEQDKKIDAYFIDKQFKGDDWKNDIFAAFNLVKQCLKDAHGIKHQDEAEWKKVLDILKNVLEKFGVTEK